MKRQQIARRDPELSRKRLLRAARDEFARNGLKGARVDEIAARSGVNKQLVYYHFGNKEELYLAVLEDTYQEIRHRERQLDLGHLDPMTAMERLVEFTFDYFTENPHFVSLLNDENLHRARHLRMSSIIKDLHSPLVEMIADTLRRGAAEGIFRNGIDPIQLYISIAGLCYFYYSNVHTLSVIFDQDLTDATAVRARRRHVLEFVKGALEAHPASDAPS